MSKKIISVFLAIAAVFFTVQINTVPAHAAGTFAAVNSDGVTIWYNTLSASTVEVTGGGSAGTVNIPSEVSDGTNTYTVTAIGDVAFKSYHGLTSVTIPDSVTYIGFSAFMDCFSLTSVTIPDSVNSIGIAAFSGCTSLTSVIIPDSVTSIGDYAFQSCYDLTSVTIPDSVTTIGESAFINCQMLSTVYFDRASQPTIGSGAFDTATPVTMLFCNNAYTASYTSTSGITFTPLATNPVVIDPLITNGTVVPSTSNGMAGETISLHITPDANYYLDSVSYNDGSGNQSLSGNYYFIMPNSSVTVTAVFKTCTVTFDNNGGFGVSPAAANTLSGGTVSLPSTNPTRSGFSFSGWNTAADGSGTAFTASTIVTGDITVYAQWTANSSSGNNSGGSSSSATRYTITASAGEGGSISPSGSASIVRGGDRSYKITAAEGYVIKDVLVDGESVGAVSSYTFEDVKKAHTIAVLFKAVEVAETAAVNPFTDVDAGDWFYDSVMYVNQNGLMNGTNPDRFSPDSTMTRAMVTTVLFRLSRDAGSYTNTFTDVSSGDWYENAAAWAKTNGVVSGAGNGEFHPGSAITREQLAVMLYNYAKYKGLDVSAGEDVNILSYGDALSISDYAYTALQWACSEQILNGDDHGNLNPRSTATRAEVAKMIAVFMRGES